MASPVTHLDHGLRGNAVMMYDYHRFASLFTEDGAWRMPHIDVELVSWEEIRAGIERLQSGTSTPLLWRARRPARRRAPAANPPTGPRPEGDPAWGRHDGRGGRI